MSDSHHADKSQRAEQELARPYPFGERIEHVESWMRGQADAARQLSARFATPSDGTEPDDKQAAWMHGYAHGMNVSAQHLAHLIDNAHKGDKK
jgi:hypothetical protein